MKTLSFILAFAFLLVGPSMAGSSDSGLPGIGTFAYNGSPIVASVLAADRGRRLANAPDIQKKSVRSRASCFFVSVQLRAVAFVILAGSAHAQVRSLINSSDPRDEFVHQCVPHMRRPLGASRIRLRLPA